MQIFKTVCLHALIIFYFTVSTTAAERAISSKDDLWLIGGFGWLVINFALICSWAGITISKIADLYTKEK